MSEYFRRAFEEALGTIGLGVLDLGELFKKESTPGTAPRYNPFTEFGLKNVVDSTAIVIDEAKALPEPKEQNEHHDRDARTGRFAKKDTYED